MKRRFLFLLLLAALRVHANEHFDRLNEAFRIAETVGSRVWPGFDVHDAPIVLVTESTEYLLNTKDGAAGFAVTDERFRDRPVFTRARVFPPNLLASFPAIGRPAVVVGTPEATQHKPETWTIVILHELFHVYQEELGMSERAAALQIGSRDDGQWQLDYPFPYTDERITNALHVLGHEIYRALESTGDRGEVVSEALQTVMDMIRLIEPKTKSAEYLKFVITKEGLARYFEYRVAKELGSEDEKYKAMLLKIRDLGRVSRSRTELYALGMGLALLLDRLQPGWQRTYFQSSLWLDDYFVRSADPRKSGTSAASDSRLRCSAPRNSGLSCNELLRSAAR